jgi:hypothetical protein
LLEANIYPLAVFLDDENAEFNRDFFYQTPNRLQDFLPDAERMENCLRLLEVSDFRPNAHLELIMVI